MSEIVLALFLAAHGLIHLGYVTPAPPDPRYPFKLDKSWLISSLHVDASYVRILGTALGALTVLGYTLAALAIMGIIVPEPLWQPLTIVSSALSLLLLILFWHPWLVIGIAIDAFLLLALLVLRWQPFVA
jgi:hypothetical protein